MCVVHKYHKEVGLNDYERFYFKYVFHDNINKLERFRKVVAKDQKEGVNRGEPYVDRHFKVKGGKAYIIHLNRKKVDAYINELKEKLIQNEKN